MFDLKNKTRRNLSHTSCGCVGQYDRLKSHGEEVHDRKIADCDEDVRYPDQKGDFLFLKGRGEDWFRCNEKFNEDKEDGEYA